MTLSLYWQKLSFCSSCVTCAHQANIAGSEPFLESRKIRRRKKKETTQDAVYSRPTITQFHKKKLSELGVIQIIVWKLFNELSSSSPHSKIDSY